MLMSDAKANIQRRWDYYRQLAEMKYTKADESSESEK
jgi:hypothetical protein